MGRPEDVAALALHTGHEDPSPDISETNRRIAGGLYIGVGFLYWFSLYAYVPTLPTYVQEKTGGLAAVGVILSMYGLWQMIIRLPLGIATDWVGRRKPFIIAGLLLSGLGAWLMGQAGGPTGLSVGRAITGLAAGTWVPLVVVFSSLFPDDSAVRATALLTSVGSIGRILATASTGSLNRLGGYELPFLVAVGAAGLAVLVMIPVKEVRQRANHPSPRQIFRLITRQEVLLPSLLNAVTQYASWAVTFGFLPIVAKTLGATDVDLSMLITLNVVLNVLGNLTTTAIASRIGARRLANLGFFVLASGIACAALAPSLAFLFVAQGLLGIAYGATYPTLMGMSIRQVANGERATAMGLHQAVYALGMFSGPMLSGVLAETVGIRPMFGFTALACLVLGLAGTRRLADR